MIEELKTAPLGTRIWFDGEKQPYRVRARSARYLVCTKPFNLKRTTIYTIVDLEENVRGTENLIFGAGQETDEQCAETIDRLEGRDIDLGWATEVSHRNRVRLEITKVEKAKC